MAGVRHRRSLVVETTMKNRNHGRDNIIAGRNTEGFILGGGNRVEDTAEHVVRGSLAVAVDFYGLAEIRFGGISGRCREPSRLGGQRNGMLANVVGRQQGRR